MTTAKEEKGIFIGKDTTGNSVKIGADKDNSSWYVLSEKTKSFIKNFKPGEEVIFSAYKKGNDNVLSFIKSVHASGKTYVKRETNAQATGALGIEKFSKGGSVQVSIEHQSFASSAAQAIQVLQGQLSTAEEVGNAWETVYKKILEVAAQAETVTEKVAEAASAEPKLEDVPLS